MYKTKISMLPDDPPKAVKKLNEYYFLYDISVSDVSYNIYKYDVILLSDNTYQVIKYYQTFLYNFKAGLKKRYLYYNYHNHIIHDNEEKRNNFDTISQTQQFIMDQEQVKTLSEYEDLIVLFNDRLHFANSLNKLLIRIKTYLKIDMLSFYNLKDYEKNYINELVHYASMKYYKLYFKIEDNTIYFDKRQQYHI